MTRPAPPKGSVCLWPLLQVNVSACRGVSWVPDIVNGCGLSGGFAVRM